MSDTLPSLLDDPVERLLNLLDRNAPRLLIGLAGMPGAGKSTIAARLAAAVNARAYPNAMITLGMDGFHLPKAQLRRMPNAEEAFARRGAAWTFDPAALAARLQQLRDGAGRETVAWPDLQHDVGDPTEAGLQVSPDTRLVLVEGLYLLLQDGEWQAVSSQFDERWYLDTPIALAMQRLVNRHAAAWGMTAEAAQARVESNDRLNAEVVLNSRGFADFRLHNLS